MAVKTRANAQKGLRAQSKIHGSKISKPRSLANRMITKPKGTISGAKQRVATNPKTQPPTGVLKSAIGANRTATSQKAVTAKGKEKKKVPRRTRRNRRKRSGSKRRRRRSTSRPKRRRRKSGSRKRRRTSGPRRRRTGKKRRSAAPKRRRRKKRATDDDE